MPTSSRPSTLDMGHLQRTTSAMGHIDSELLAEADEPPERKNHLVDSPRLDAAFIKHLPPAFTRRESLLTRQLHSPEPEHPLEDEHQRARAIVRGMSAWSNHSIASTAELTSDNDLTSPGTRESTPSPPLPPTLVRESIPALEKSPHKELVIVGDSKVKPEKSVEAELGRPRCITFACGGKKPASTHVASESEQEKQQAPVLALADPPKRKTCITFACPSKPAVQTSPLKEKTKSMTLAPSQGAKMRIVSPGPRTSKTQASPKHFPRNHRGSDSTVKNDSPKSLRKTPTLPVRRRKYSIDNDDVPGEERRFHEFGPSEEENEQWLEESGCYRQRLTVNDTLYKENIIRQIGEEVEEEAIEEDEDLEDEELEEDEDDEDLEDVDVEEAISGDEVSDAGFQTDDEDGFAVSDNEDDDSENEWWAPGGRSTAATSMEQLEPIRHRRRTNSDSSLGSAHGENKTASAPYGMVKRRSRALKINRPHTPDLPDSTDFVCGTLDEDRPLEQAYIMSLERRKAAKHKVKPQDIDPTFPTSDPDMDEEDDDDEDDEDEESDHPLFMQGKIEITEELGYRGRRVSKTATKKKSISPPHQRLRSPPPPKHRSHRSPPPSAKRLRSPAPIKRTAHKSPPPRKLFGQSPRRMKSPPPPPRRPTSPPPSPRSSVEGVSAISFTPRATLARRPQPTHTASLPRVESQIKIGKHAMATSPDEHDDPLSGLRTARGAIDIVKGLEKKRQRRKEKLYQKHCQKGGKERERKPKPGKGAERMREVGLELAAYKGKKQHVLSY
ncbi:hypothetical protein AUEXF2481DRAFT_26164 [Aureobasidium subglaciale EXF-2481]|uniref:Uncharacterized protein n=1 Tax=Aureobasidium subglaciale (strain EXF-2481) TaxID=1043005 RepID=A0A074YM70_AURSE|nr:uncharacterized protein AUEXF2481DRAFT_26164 [Aureobasidium subglaciale EXF-2481]KAI5205619.1 hypothetical protein E4T38_04133 [Aureobasidium subglaciale]KAI5224548.1 hypothetical protein E4T40_04056 [Aureobasidium subglaciale]KAI5227808.1 hypothetical protein E4T41_04276 [Aureobasidium subglaciale]KAI5263212.1 hypothetical protein E4T46_03897 [Aureobasidium subglaciale]KEQ98923.1 hypothetical protein AUEXF2481DRAFT_26164 [Aureobasidium subglaciale EXF-2481]